MHLEHQPGGTPFLATNCGTGLAPEISCQHGEAAFALHLLGRWPAAAGKSGAGINVLMPRCVAAQMVGALGAFLAHEEGEDAAEAFMEQSRHAFDVILQQLRDLAAQGRDCCEAAFRTGGREHTCRTEVQP